MSIGIWIINTLIRKKMEIVADMKEYELQVFWRSDIKKVDQEVKMISKYTLYFADYRAGGKPKK